MPDEQKASKELIRSSRQLLEESKRLMKEQQKTVTEIHKSRESKTEVKTPVGVRGQAAMG